MKGNQYRKHSNRDDFALKYYCRRSREFEKKKLRRATKKSVRTQDKKDIKEGIEDYEESNCIH